MIVRWKDIWKTGLISSVYISHSLPFLLDGGSEVYMGLGGIYTVMYFNQLPDSFDENGKGYYQTGIQINVLGMTVYEDKHPDYSKPFVLRPHSSEVEKINEEIERALGGSQTTVSKEHKDE